MPPKKTTAKSSSLPDDKAIAAVGYIWILFVVPLLLKRNSEFVQWHAKQGLVLFLFEVLVIILGMIPLLGWFLIMPIGFLVSAALAVLGILNSLNGNKWEMPVLGKYAQRIGF